MTFNRRPNRRFCRSVNGGFVAEPSHAFIIGRSKGGISRELCEAQLVWHSSPFLVSGCRSRPRLLGDNQCPIRRIYTNSEEDRHVVHNLNGCPEGSEIEPRRRQDGTGFGRVICEWCAQHNAPIAVSQSAVRLFAEATLALVLFADASRINLQALKLEYALPLRLLGIGLPLTILLGGLVAGIMFGGL
jgi:hypothetical protein